ncbi:advillin-like isoform X1 [Anneissia japonica]|uniref:advillin-like isoform X1 n=1 Tax=Anneissia japonica TaxID=1529436 RepID=UPI00142577C4|nr:advillin-like isoform X1 [Anneissia japonica]
MALQVDPAFRDAGKKEGLKIWRIENMKVVSWPEKDYGHFFQGDSYIVLHTRKVGSGFEWNIHFWLGRETSNDEAGVAAYKTVELDDHLGGSPVQHREVQEHEGQLFISYFKKGIRYQTGGIKSGFKHVDRTKFEKRLLKVKGKRNVRVIPVALEWASLNQGDVFILDLGQQIFVWHGTESNRKEKMKGIEVAQSIRDDERGGRAHIEVLNGAQKEINPVALAALGGQKGSIASASAGGDDEKFSRKLQANTKLYKVTDESGSLVVTEIGGPPLSQDSLNSKDCFIVDQGPSGIFVWKGKGATKNEKDRAFKNALGFIKAKKYPSHTPVTTVIENGEPAQFKAIFKNWRDKGDVTGPGKTYSVGRGIARVQQKKFDASTLHQVKTSDLESDPAMAAQLKMFDAGDGKIEIWRVENFDLHPLEKQLYGQFFGGDSYVILYTYRQRGREQYIIYYWLGRESSKDEMGTAALKATEMDDKYGGAPVQIRVVQGKEPNHFLQIFKGKLIIHKGGKASGFKNSSEKDKSYTGGCRVFQVKGTNEFNTRAVEVPAKASSLNSNDIFVIQNKKQVFLWCGKGGSGDERQLSKNIAKTISPVGDFTMVPEGQEPSDLWTILGGKSTYASDKVFGDEIPTHPARLFQCSNASGNFTVEEIHNFVQDDLIEDDVMMLDTYDELFIWIGKGANETEKKEVMKTAKEYIQTDPSGRKDDSVLLITVKQGYEPINFTGHFMAWDDNMFDGSMSLDEKVNQLNKENSGITITKLTEADFKVPAVEDDPSTLPNYSLAQLKLDELPDGVDPTKKELYLSEEDFKTHFGMEYEKFKAIPKWKQANLKKKAGIF